MAVTAREASDSPGTSTSDGVSNSLYLFTFLATLLLLVLITSSIILRSLIIRARFRVQQEEVAIARGVPNSAPRVHRRKHRLGEKPKLYNTWITSESDETVGQWHGMMPLGAQVIKDPIRKARIARERLMASRLQHYASCHLERDPHPPPPLLKVKTPVDRRIVQLSVLITLPRPHQCQGTGEIALGTISVPVELVDDKEH